MHHESLGGQAAVPWVYRKCKEVFCVLTRNYNSNILVWEVTAPHNAKSPIESYWLDLEPSYRASARAAGRLHDRCERGITDEIPYGYTVNTIDPGNTWEMTMRQVPYVPITVQREVLRDRKGTVRTVYNGYLQLQSAPDKPSVLCRLQHIHVHDYMTAFGLPHADKVSVYGLERGTGRSIVQQFSK